MRIKDIVKEGTFDDFDMKDYGKEMDDSRDRAALPRDAERAVAPQQLSRSEHIR